MKRIKGILKRSRLFSKFQLFMRKMIGVDSLHTEIETLQYFLNAIHAPSELQITKDSDLRILQLCDVQLLRIVTKICDANNLTYWLAYGTLLGSVRHRGFIPWDDDMDIEMPRSDYDRALCVLRDALEPMGISLYDNGNNIGVGYKHLETGIWLDIFADDEYYADTYDDAFSYLNSAMPRYRKVYGRNQKKATTDWKAETRKRIIGEGKGIHAYLYLQPEFLYLKEIIRPKDIVIPLIEREYEGYLFKAPNDVDAYLRGVYGNNYMGFPRKDILHHDLGRGALSTWAKRCGIDMNQVLSYLTKMADADYSI